MSGASPPLLPTTSPAPALARTLTVLTFASQSLRPPVVPALVWPVADPEDVLDYGLDFTPSLLPGEQIVSASVLQSPASLKVSPVSYSLSPFLATVTVLGVWLSGGADQTTYALAVKVVTTGGRTLHIGATLPVVARAAPTPANASGVAP